MNKNSRYWTKYEFRWAIIFTLISLLWAVIEVELGWHTFKYFDNHISFTYLFIIPAAVCYFMFFYDKRTHRFKKRFKLKHAFKSGLVLSFLIALINIPMQWIIHFLVSPEYLNTLRLYLMDKHHITGETASLINLYNAMWFFPLLLFSLGIVLTIIYAVFLRKSTYNK